MTFLDPSASIFDATVSRSGPETLRVSWKTRPRNRPVAVYHGTAPKSIHRRIPLGPSRGQAGVTLSELSPHAAHYFKVVPEGGEAIIVGERRLPLQNTVNTRDLGGYETAEGRRVKWGEVFRRLADPKGLPLLFHCTGGKDRAGTFAALLLLALDVPEETVVYDYGLSNAYIADVVDQIYAQFKIDAEYRKKIAPYFSAPPYFIEATLSHLHDQYGSPIEYLTSRAGVTEQMLQAIKSHLLE